MAKKIAKKVAAPKVARKPRASKKKQAAQAAEQAQQETNNYMNDLIKAATEFFQAGTAYFTKQNGFISAPAPMAAAPEPAKDEAAAEPAKRTRRTKEQIAADEAAADPLAALGLPSEAAAPAPAAPKPLTDKESSDLLMKTAMEYVGHFGKDKGTAQAKAHLKPYKADKITGLTHEQRLPYIETLKAELAAAK